MISMTVFRPSTVGFLALDILVSENLKFPSEVTKYPVEDGTEEISDHITQGNEELSITGRVSSSQILSFDFGRCISKLVDAVDQLRSMHKAREPVRVNTGLGVYEDMAFTSLSVTRSNGADGGNWLDINADLRKIKKVAVKETELPEDKVSTDASAGGAKGRAGTTGAKGGASGNSQTPPVNTDGPTQNAWYKGMKSTAPISAAIPSEAVMFVLPMADRNSQSIESILDDEVFYIILDWNESGQYWEMGIRNSAYITVLDGICVTPNSFLLKQFKYPDVCRGELMMNLNKDVNGPPPRKGLTNKTFEFIYFPHEEMLVFLNAI